MRDRANIEKSIRFILQPIAHVKQRCHEWHSLLDIDILFVSVKSIDGYLQQMAILEAPKNLLSSSS